MLKNGKKYAFADFYGVFPSELIEIEVDCYIPSKGGFMKPIRLYITNEMANKLSRCKDVDYWDTITLIKEILAKWAGIPGWKESWKERTSFGDPEAPISIIALRRV